MVHAAEEAPEFSRISGAVVINIGTLSQPWLDSMLLTAQAASQASVPWVLDRSPTMPPPSAATRCAGCWR